MTAPSDGPGGDFNLFGESPLNGEWYLRCAELRREGAVLNSPRFGLKSGYIHSPKRTPA